MKRIIAGFLAVFLLLCPILTGGISAYAASNDKDNTKDYGNEWNLKYDEIPFRVKSDYGSGSDQIIVQAQGLLISYNALVIQRAEMDRQLQVAKKTFEAARIRVELKMMTQLDFDNLKGNLDKLESSIASIDTQIESMRKSFGTLVGGNYKGKYDDGDKEHRIRLAGLPDVHKFVKDLDIHYSTDVDNISSGGNVQTEQSKASFSKIYQEIRDKEKLLEKEEQYYELEKKNFDAAKLKNQLGIVSNLELINAQNILDVQAFKVKTAETALFTAAARYDWAIAYNIVSST